MSNLPLRAINGLISWNNVIKQDKGERGSREVEREESIFESNLPDRNIYTVRYDFRVSKIIRKPVICDV